MLERFNPLLRVVCLALAGLVLYQLSRVVMKPNVIAHSAIQAPAPKAQKPAGSTNAAPSPASSTNTTTTDLSASTNASNVKTNAPGPGARTASAARRAGGPPAGPRMGPGGGAPVPPEIQAAVDKIKQSQVLGVEMKPPPAALIGIAGKDVFLRGSDGQTGVIREGETLGGLKLLKVGINRVLVEENGEEKELTVFNGFGSETLLPQKKDKSEPPR